MHIRNGFAYADSTNHQIQHAFTLIRSRAQTVAREIVAPTAYYTPKFDKMITKVKDAEKRTAIIRDAYRKLVEPASDPPFIYARSTQVCCLLNNSIRMITYINTIITKAAGPDDESDPESPSFDHKYGDRPYSHSAIKMSILHLWFKKSGIGKTEFGALEETPLPMIALAATSVSFLF